jgi:hypothetical protein
MTLLSFNEHYQAGQVSVKFVASRISLLGERAMQRATVGVAIEAIPCVISRYLHKSNARSGAFHTSECVERLQGPTNEGQ